MDVEKVFTMSRSMRAQKIDWTLYEAGSGFDPSRDPGAGRLYHCGFFGSWPASVETSEKSSFFKLKKERNVRIIVG